MSNLKQFSQLFSQRNNSNSQ